MIGLQLYTVRDKIRDYDTAYSTVKNVIGMGYECVQLAAGKMDVVECTAQACKDLGVSVVGILANIDICEKETEKLFEIAKNCGAYDIGISSSIKTEKEAEYIIAHANSFAKIARENGFTFSYHNHSNEFIRGEHGKTLMQLLIDGFESEYVDFMPDTYWLQHGGADVRAFIESIKGRVKILHLKDMKRTSEGQTFSELGVGNINFAGIIETAKKCGVEHFIVEQDRCDSDSLDSARISCDFLKSMI